MIHLTLSKSSRFFFYPVIRVCEYLGNHHPVFLLKLRYWVVFRKKLNLEDPQDLNEKILWAKLYADTSQWSILADKYKVRKYIEEKGFAHTLVKLYAVWYDKSDVNFDVLPESFIIKANNGDGKGTNKIIHKRDLTPKKKREYIKLVDYWLKRKNIGALHAEPQYKHIDPCVVVEEVLPLEPGATSLTDYKCWCFNGKCQGIFVCSNRSASGESIEVMLYDTQWNPMPQKLSYDDEVVQGTPTPAPKNLKQMIETAEQMSQGFPQVRVDLYNINGKIYFGELTFTAQGGLMTNYQPDVLKQWGQLFSISQYKKR